ncbi:MAG: energy-coupling factor ABC transporter ATP-binding protein [Candidatus Asgardarchaeia archaeon]
MSSEDAVFELNEVSYIYPNNVVAFEKVSLKINKGERVAIVGPNGAGKTTLLHMLDALIFPKEGTIKIFGFPISEKMNLLPIRRKIGYIMQDVDSALFTNTVYDEISFGLRQLSLSPDEVKARCEEIMESMGISNLRNRHPFHLSFGEKKKVLLAAVLVLDPDVILFDEPTTEVDAKWREWIIDMINELHKKNKTIVVATHDVEAIPYIADRVIVFNKRVIADDSVVNIFSDESLLRKANLTMPTISKIYLAGKKLGLFNQTRFPVTIDDFVKLMEDECNQKRGK